MPIQLLIFVFGIRCHCDLFATQSTILAIKSFSVYCLMKKKCDVSSKQIKNENKNSNQKTKLKIEASTFLREKGAIYVARTSPYII